MKKILITLALVAAIAFSGIGLVEAQEPMEGCDLVREIEYDGRTYSDHVDIDEDDGVGAVVCMINTVNRGAQILFYLMMGLVAGLVTFGGFLILTSGGSEEKVGQGKKYITYAIIGVFVAVFAYALPALLGFIMG